MFFPVCQFIVIFFQFQRPIINGSVFLQKYNTSFAVQLRVQAEDCEKQLFALFALSWLLQLA